MRRTPRTTVELLVPGFTLFVVLLIGSIVVRALPVLLFVVLFFYGFGLIPIAAFLAIVALTFFHWRRHWLSGFSLICAVLLVFAFGTFPNPVSSPVGWTANVLKVIYYHDALQRSYLEAKKSGQTSPVGQVYTDGFGSLTSGLAYDPSNQIALPASTRSKAWTDGPGATELGIDSLEAHHIIGPYYQWFHP